MRFILYNIGYARESLNFRLKSLAFQFALVQFRKVLEVRFPLMKQNAKGNYKVLELTIHCIYPALKQRWWRSKRHNSWGRNVKVK